MLRSKKLKKINTINHGFFNSLGGFSSGIYKSLNCGMGSKDNKKYVKKNLKYVAKKIGAKKIVLLHQVHGKKIKILSKISKQDSGLLEISKRNTEFSLNRATKKKRDLVKKNNIINLYQSFQNP